MSTDKGALLEYVHSRFLFLSWNVFVCKQNDILSSTQCTVHIVVTHDCTIRGYLSHFYLDDWELKYIFSIRISAINQVRGNKTLILNFALFLPFSRLALYVYEYLLHIGAQKAAQTFLSEIRWEKNITLGEPPGFLHSWWW